jgi:Holliday junction DNA helicase RuvB
VEIKTERQLENNQEILYMSCKLQVSLRTGPFRKYFLNSEDEMLMTALVVRDCRIGIMILDPIKGPVDTQAHNVFSLTRQKRGDQYTDAGFINLKTNILENFLGGGEHLYNPPRTLLLSFENWDSEDRYLVVEPSPFEEVKFTGDCKVALRHETLPPKPKRDLKAPPRVNLRPKQFDDFIGQENVTGELRNVVEVHKARKEVIPHIFLYGPPGLGKTCIAEIVGEEFGVDLVKISGPAVKSSFDFYGILEQLNIGDVLFIDEIHAMYLKAQRFLLEVMERFTVQKVEGKGGHARTVQQKVSPFTLIGATTDMGRVSDPMLGRFIYRLGLEWYSPIELVEILSRLANAMKVDLDDDAAMEIARRSRGTPREAENIFLAVRNHHTSMKEGKVSTAGVLKYCEDKGIDDYGLGPFERNIIVTIVEKHGGEGVGLENLVASTGLFSDTSATVRKLESWLLFLGFLEVRSGKGRVLTETGFKYYARIKAKKEVEAEKRKLIAEERKRMREELETEIRQTAVATVT